MAEDDALFQKGMPIRREVLGPEYVDSSTARADEFMMSFQRTTTARITISSTSRSSPKVCDREVISRSGGICDKKWSA